MKQYYVEYLNSNEFNNIFCDSKDFQNLKKCPWIKLLLVKKANVLTDRWETIEL